MTRIAPRAFNREMYHDHRENVFYGTDDGAQDGSGRELLDFEAHYNSVAAWRREDIHMVSVVGGLYGLNLLPMWKPRRLTIFDINPAAVTYFEIVRKLWTSSSSAAELLEHFTKADYEVEGELAEFVRENIRLKQAGALPRERGSTKRPYEQSWQYALERFDLTKQLLRDCPLDVRTVPMESEEFATWIRAQSNLWIYASNITQFHFFDLEFADPRNCVIIQIIFPEQPQLLDLAEFSGALVRVKFEIPLAVERLGG